MKDRDKLGKVMAGQDRKGLDRTKQVSVGQDWKGHVRLGYIRSGRVRMDQDG